MSKNSQSAYHKIYQVVRQIPIGKVTTYGRVADLAGLYGKSRLVGYAMFQVDPNSDIPWQRVVNAKGEISYSIARDGGDYMQKILLEREGILFNDRGKIDLKQYLWQVSASYFDSIFFELVEANLDEYL
jgi:methylated-DNA-protein-cysteine methyltransferase related protein